MTERLLLADAHADRISTTYNEHVQHIIDMLCCYSLTQYHCDFVV
jgi:hypothetical protein